MKPLPSLAYYVHRRQAREFLASALHWRDVSPLRARACWLACKLCLSNARLSRIT